MGFLMGRRAARVSMEGRAPELGAVSEDTIERLPVILRKLKSSFQVPF